MDKQGWGHGTALLPHNHQLQQLLYSRKIILTCSYVGEWFMWESCCVIITVFSGLVSAWSTGEAQLNWFRFLNIYRTSHKMYPPQTSYMYINKTSERCRDDNGVKGTHTHVHVHIRSVFYHSTTPTQPSQHNHYPLQLPGILLLFTVCIVGMVL